MCPLVFPPSTSGKTTQKRAILVCGRARRPKRGVERRTGGEVVIEGVGWGLLVVDESNMRKQLYLVLFCIMIGQSVQRRTNRSWWRHTARKP